MFPFRIVNSFEINVKVKCFTEFRRKKKKEGEKILAVECYVCVFVCVSVCIQLSLLQGKIKAYINTQLSERDINHNKEISGHIRGSVVQLLGRRRKEQVLKGIPSRAPTKQRLFCTCSWAQLSTQSRAPPGGAGRPCREVLVWAHTDFPSLCLFHSNTRPCPQVSRCSVRGRLGSWRCPW